jgi:hypothetical protein
MGTRTGGKRGAPFGNRNSVKHGRYTAASRAARKRLSVQIQETMLLQSLTRTLLRLDQARRAGGDIAQFGFVLRER